MAYNGIVPSQTFGQGSKDSFDGDGSTTAFTLSKAVKLATDIEVFVGNVRQEPDVAYTVSGVTLTFTGTPASGTGNIYAVHQTANQGTLVPPTGRAENLSTLVTSGTITSGGTVAVTGNVTATGTVEPAGDTAAGDNAAIGFTAAEGLILTGQGSTNDVTIKNDADADVIEIPTGTTNVTVAGTLGTGGLITSGAGITGAGLLTTGGNIVIPNAGTIGSAGDADSIAISSGGVVTFSQIPVGAFIPEYDIHRITTNTDNTADAYITANWERCDDAEFEKIGTGLSQSSGIFSFPSTGKYLITAFLSVQARSGTVPQGKTNLYTTTDNSTYVVSAVAEMHGAADQVTTVSMSILFDVTNTTTHKVRLGLITAANNIRALGSSAENRTYITFMKLGAT